MSDKAVITCALNGVLTDPKQHHLNVSTSESCVASECTVRPGCIPGRWNTTS